MTLLLLLCERLILCLNNEFMRNFRVVKEDRKAQDANATEKKHRATTELIYDYVFLFWMNVNSVIIFHLRHGRAGNGKHQGDAGEWQTVRFGNCIRAGMILEIL